VGNHHVIARARGGRRHGILPLRAHSTVMGGKLTEWRNDINNVHYGRLEADIARTQGTCFGQWVGVIEDKC